MNEFIGWISDVVENHFWGIIQGIFLASLFGIVCEQINRAVGFANPNFNPIDVSSFTKSVNAIFNVWDMVGIWTGALTAIPALGKWFVDWMNGKVPGNYSRRKK